MNFEFKRSIFLCTMPGIDQQKYCQQLAEHSFQYYNINILIVLILQ